MFKFEKIEGRLAVRKVVKGGIFKGYVRISKAPYFYRHRKCAIYATNANGMGIKGGLKFCLEFL